MQISRSRCAAVACGFVVASVLALATTSGSLGLQLQPRPLTSLLVPTGSAGPTCSAVPAWPVTAPLGAPNCTAAQADWQAASFAGELGMELTDKMSACASGEWMARLRDVDAGEAGCSTTPVRRRVFNVGANKGYLAAALLAHWWPGTGASPRTLYDFLSRLPPGVAPPLAARCGVCSDCVAPVVPPPAALAAVARRNLSMVVHAVEPMPSNVKLLAAYAASLARGAGGDHGGADEGAPTEPPDAPPLTVHAYALANFVGTFAIEERGPGDEGASLGNANEGRGPRVAVNVTTVDALADELFGGRLRGPRDAEGVPAAGDGVRLDMLLIDAEGHDPAVMAGAAGTLHATRLLVFEYHGLARWNASDPNATTLEATVARLDADFGFDCYLEWTGGPFRLTGCWRNAFEFRRWSNVICVNRRGAAWTTALRATATMRWEMQL